VPSQEQRAVTAATQQSIIAAGYAPLDIVTYRGRVWHAAGGSAGNVASILGFLGWSASLAVDFGDDLAGRHARRDLKKANVSVDLVRLVDGQPTPRLVHEITDSGHRYHWRCPSCHRAFPMSRPLRTDRARELIDMDLSPDVFFFDRLNAGTILLAEHFATAGSLVVFEPSRPARADLTQRALKVAHVIKHADNREAGLDDTTPATNQVWIVTGGAQGARFRVGRGSWHKSPAFSYPVVDTGGAGDWTTAGLVHALPHDTRRTVAAVGDALRWAQALAAVSCGAPGARGLARQHSADAVVRAAKFLEQRGESSAAGQHVIKWSKSSVPTATCRWCLQTSRVELDVTGTDG
jgi:fructokinase